MAAENKVAAEAEARVKAEQTVVACAQSRSAAEAHARESAQQRARVEQELARTASAIAEQAARACAESEARNRAQGTGPQGCSLEVHASTRSRCGSAYGLVHAGISACTANISDSGGDARPCRSSRCS